MTRPLEPLDEPVVRLCFEFPDGEVFDRVYTIATAEDLPDGFRAGQTQAPPDWLEEPRREREHPRDPVTLRGRVVVGREAEARAALGIEQP